MRRLALHTLNAMTVLSLLLCVGTVGAFLACDFSGDQPPQWRWTDAGAAERHVVVAADEIRLTQSWVVARGPLTFP